MTLAFKTVQYKHRHDENKNAFNSFMLYLMYNKQYHDIQEDSSKTLP